MIISISLRILQASTAMCACVCGGGGRLKLAIMGRQRLPGDNTESACMIVSEREFHWGTVFGVTEFFSLDVLVCGTTSLCLLVLPRMGQ